MLGYLKKIIRTFITITLLLSAIGAATVLGVVIYYSRDLPDYQTLASYTPPVATRLYAADGKLMEEYAKEHRLFVPVSAIPKQVINAFLAAEDKNFYSHPGIDITSLIRAMVQNVINLSSHKSLVGGSTITQQVVKNFLLTNERSLTRKVKEAILSFRISQIYSKDRILELYLNQIYLGSGSYGIAAAALNYFDHSLDDLSIDEVAFLAALPKAPSTYDPRRNYDKALHRRNWVIKRMEQDGFITADEASQAIERPITLRSRGATEIAEADFFAETVRKEITARYGSSILYNGGLAVRTTLDPLLQDIAERSFRSGLVRYDRRHGYRGATDHLKTLDNWQEQLGQLDNDGIISPWELAVILQETNDTLIIGTKNGQKGIVLATELGWAKKSDKTLRVKDVIIVEPLTDNKKQPSYGIRQIPEVSGGMVVMDPHTGKILALVGGYYYGESQFNRATQAKRQPGSAFKPFVYLSALESGFTPATLVLDGPIELSQGAGLPVWRPKNYSGDFMGPTTLRRGVEKSRNLMTVRLAQMLGINKIMEITQRFDINEQPERNFSTVLGASETTLLQLTNAYAIIVGGGKQLSPSFIEQIQDRNGTTIFKRDERNCQGCIVSPDIPLSDIAVPMLEDNREMVTDPRSAYQIISIMEGVVQRGTAVSARKLGRTLGGKTGTTNDSVDAWFMGFSPDLVVGTYVGFDNPRSLGKRETGSSVALPIFIDFMQEATQNKPDRPFRIPQGIQLVKIDAKTGQLATSATPDNSILYEAFKTGTQPQASAISASPIDIETPTTPSPSPLTGTGGIY